jgi:hypothetical protein
VYTWEQIQPLIDATESGGDYNALYNYQNRPDGRFSDVRVTDMSVGDVLSFTNPQGAYADYVRGQVGRVATPVGRYQVVGSTLRNAVEALGIDPSTPFNPATQDRIGRWIFENQGPSAWEGLTRGGNMNGLLGGGQATASSMNPQQPEQNRFFNADTRDRLIMALQGMTLNPNQALIQTAAQNLQQRAAQRREDEKTAQERNATLEWLRNSGVPNADLLISGVETGALSGADAANSALTAVRAQQAAASDPNVQSSSILPDSSGVLMTMRDGSVQIRTAGGDILSGQEATDFVQRANENAAELERITYGARRTGTLEAETEGGGAAAAAVEEGRLRAIRADEAYTQASNISSNIANIDDALAALNRGARSGIIANYFPSIRESSAALENAMNRMGLDVIGSVTFGALSEGEMRLAMDTAVPRGLEGDELREWLNNKRNAQVKAREALMRAAQFFSNPNNTLNDWISRQENAPAPASGGGGGATTRLRFDAEGNIIND